MNKILATMALAAITFPVTVNAQSTTTMTTAQLIAVGVENGVCGDRAVVGATLQGTSSIVFSCGAQPVSAPARTAAPLAPNLGLVAAVSALVVAGALASGAGGSTVDSQ